MDLYTELKNLKERLHILTLENTSPIYLIEFEEKINDIQNIIKFVEGNFVTNLQKLKG